MNIGYSFLITSLAGLSTMLGMVVLLFNKKSKNKIIAASLSFAAGVMLCVSLLDLIPESINLLTSRYKNFVSIMFFLIFLCIGVLTSMFIDKKMPENKDNNGLYRVGIISMLAIILHNIPEGIATFMASSLDTKLGLSLAVAIAMHNIPEGISISVPIYYSTKNIRKSLLYTLVSALSEPLGAILAFLFLQNFVTDSFMGMLFAFIAGIMTHISFYELLPTSKKYNENKLTSLFFIIGIIFMCINLFIL
ncbi:MAG: ZIP family metal transporter [Bacilli bacterium]|nr:ZIP family metal transporter [Bacilli bacterium]